MTRAMTLLVGAALTAALSGCTGGDDADAATAPAAVAIVPAALAAGAWQLDVADPAALSALGANPGWTARFAWDLPAAAAAFAGDDAPSSKAALARMHAEMGALYRQAALIQAHSILETYKPEQRRDGDPVEVVYLLGVAHAILGDREAAREHFGQSAGSGVAGLPEADAAWAGLAASDDFALNVLGASGLYGLPAVAPGQTPTPKPAPHFSLPETVGELTVEAADPTVTLQLAMWHRAAAEAADPAVAAAVLSPWLLSLEPPAAPGEVGLEALFLGPWPTAADLAFVATGEASEGALFDAALSACPGERPDLYCVQESAQNLARQLQAAMAEAGGGAHGDHRSLAAQAQLGLLRHASRRAFADGDRELGARLMIGAIDLSAGATGDPIFLLKTAAWDASVRNTLRAQQNLHGQINRLPGLDAARRSLDALAVRVSRDAGPAVPLH